MIISEKQTNSFWENVVKTDSCWIYGKGSSRWNYGHVTINRKSIVAHRVSYIIHHGEIPIGMFVCHKCDNPPCVNPDHLFLGTAKDNTADMMSKGRGALKYGEKHPSAKLREQDVKEIFHLSGLISQREIARMFNVSQGLIQRILKHQAWKNITSSLKSMSATGLASNRKGIRSARAKLSEQEVLYIFSMKGRKDRFDLAKQFNVHEVSIRKIWGKQTWRHITC